MTLRDLIHEYYDTCDDTVEHQWNDTYRGHAICNIEMFTHWLDKNYPGLLDENEVIFEDDDYPPIY